MINGFHALSMTPPDGNANADKCHQAQSGYTPYSDGKRYGYIQCSEAGQQSNKKQRRNYKFIKFQFFGSLFYQNCFHHIFRSVEADNGVPWRWNICRFYPLCHHLETGEVLRQSREAVTVTAENEANDLTSQAWGVGEDVKKTSGFE